METYRIIEGYENYSVSDLGNVRNNTSGRIMKTRIQNGYIILNLFKDDHRFTKKYTVLLLEHLYLTPKKSRLLIIKITKKTIIFYQILDGLPDQKIIKT